VHATLIVFPSCALNSRHMWKTKSEMWLLTSASHYCPCRRRTGVFATACHCFFLQYQIHMLTKGHEYT